MAHRLVPKQGGAFLPPTEIVRRLKQEFDFVGADKEAGADHVGDMIVQLLRMKAPDEIIRRHRMAQAEAIQVVVSDSPSSDDAEIVFVAMPGEALFIGYASSQHEEAAARILAKCGNALGYEIVLV